MSGERRTVRQEDGRLLDVLIIGPEDGFPLVFHNGTPGGLIGFASMTHEASSRGLRTVMYGRPGYGGSTPSPDGGWWTRPPTWPRSSTGSARTAS